jgi:tRNA nucleotidyltransferase (CCA-adding enzyme)
LGSFDALSEVFPVVSELQDVPAGPPEHHREGSAYEHTMRVISEAHKIDESNDRLLWAALGHDFGKIATDKKDIPSHPKHEKNGPSVVNRFSKDLNLGNNRTRLMKRAARYHMRFWNVPDLREATLLRMVDDFGGHAITIDEFINLGLADGRGRDPPTVRVDVGEVRRHIYATKKAFDSIKGEDILEQFDVEPENGEKIYELLLQERIRELKSLRDDI